jgi:uncharacterized protein involved in outer membrane biogenesis
MSRRRRIFLVAIALLVFLPIAFVVFVATLDWNRAKPWVQARASSALGRSVEIGGALVANWHWHVQLDGTDTFSPGFGFTASAVRIGNPEWAKRPRFAELESLDLDLRLLPLLWHRLDIPVIRLVKPSLDFEQRKDNRNTWTFEPTDKETGSVWTVNIGEIAFDTGEVTITDAQRALDVHADITRLDAPIPFGQHVDGDDPSTRREVIRRVGRAAAERLRDAVKERDTRAVERGHERKPPSPYVFAWKASGTLQGDKFTGEGRFGGVFSLNDPKPFPVRADIEVGATEIALTGTITDPASPDALDMRLWITGPNLRRLYAITGIALPSTPPYATVGRLAGHFHPRRSVLRYEDFTARVGGSDLAGTLTYRTEGERPTLTGNVDSTLLQFRDLGALIGVGTAEDRAARGDTSAEPPHRVLPVEPFEVDRWKAMDADVHFTGKRVVRTRELPISDVESRIRMQSGVLTLDPLRFDMAGGNVGSSIRIDANASPPKGVVSLDARGLKLRRLFEKVEGLADSAGEIDGDVKLAGSGRSLGALLGASNGALRLLMTDGEVSETLMEEAGLNFANVLMAKLRGDKQIHIDCAAAALTVKDGVANPDLFVVDTENALVEVDGTVDLRNERIDLTLHPHTKGLRIFSLRSPLHAEGDFEHIDVSVDKKSLLARGGGAIGLALVAAPLAALVPLIAPGNDDDRKSCTPLVTELKKGGKQPSPATAPAKHAPRASDGAGSASRDS